MRAQVLNDASGWNDLAYAPFAESEPVEPEQIKGNYTHTELSGDQTYAMTFSIAQANDYNGYIATYREYQRGDHYRKALTGWGPHSSDYMATRLVEMGGQMRGGPSGGRAAAGEERGRSGAPGRARDRARRPGRPVRAGLRGDAAG